MKIPLSVQIGGEIIDYSLHETEEESYVIWKNASDEPFKEGCELEIIYNKDKKAIIDIKIGSQIETPRYEIEDSFLDALHRAHITELDDLADGFEPEHGSNEYSRLSEDTPYDPKRIRVDTKPLSIEYVCGLIQKGKLDLSPDFQREFVWTEITRKTRLIESIMLRIPLPVFYLSQDVEGQFQVVDGIQRLTVINDFVRNKFRLKNLEYLIDLEGKWFRADGKPKDKSIPELYAERIEQTQLFFNIIDPSTPGQVKYDIFRRINTGGKALNAQEIRNCLSKPQTRKLLHDMVKLDSFVKATRGSIRRTRMADTDMAMRFVGFYLLDKKLLDYEYRGIMDEFLNYVTEHLNKKMNKSMHDDIVKAFDMAMENAFALFGSSAFRKSSHINKALFLAWSRQLHMVENEELCSIPSLESRAKAMLRESVEKDTRFINSITKGTNDIESIRNANETAKSILKELLS